MNALYAFAPLRVLNLIAGEDRPVEWAGTTALLAAGVLFTLAFIRSRGRGFNFWVVRTGRQPILLALALLMFFAVGEELSWGQRIFGFNTPGPLAAMNEQREFNLHNVGIFNPTVGGELKSQLDLLFTANRTFALFVLGFAGVWPLLHAASARVRRVNQYFRVPVAPLWLTPLVFAILALVYPVSGFVPDGFHLGYVHELKESLYSVALAATGWRAYRAQFQ